MNNNPTSNSPPTEERLAQLTGFHPTFAPLEDDEAAPPISSNPQLLSDDDLDEQITRHSFASSPLSKLVFVAGAMFLVVFLASLFVSQFQSSEELVSAQKSGESKEKEQSPLLSSDTKDKEKSELLSELALREQQERLKDLEAQKTKKKSETAPKPQKIVIRTVKSSPPPAQPVVRQPPPRPVRYERTPLPRYPITYRPANTVVRSSYPPVRQQDPQEVWVELSQVGSFGTGVSNSPTKAPNRSNSQYQPQSANKITLKNPQPPELSKLEAIPSSDKAISFGQSVSAVLETAIAWEGSRGNQGEFNSDDRYILTLNEPLQDNSGNTVIPSGSQLVVRLEGTNNAIANLVAESIIIDRQETKLTQGALKVRGEEGQALIPKVKKLGGNSRDDAEFLTDILSVAGDFADIPGSRSINSLYRTLTGGRNRGGSGVTTTIFYLPQGTRVEVFVNKSFSVDSPEQPLELDFSNELNYSEGE